MAGHWKRYSRILIFVLAVAAPVTGILFVGSSMFATPADPSPSADPVQTHETDRSTTTPEVRTKVVTREVVKTKTVVKTPTPTPTPEPARNPFGRHVLPVMVHDSTSYQRQEVSAAVHYWNTDGAAYVDYDIELKLVTEDPRDRPLVNVSYTTDIPQKCNSKYERTIGCAGGLEGDSGARIAFPKIFIKEEMEVCKSIDVLKHEFGHILGLTHSNGPAFMEEAYSGCYK